MPTDTKRLKRPDDSKSPLLYSTSNESVPIETLLDHQGSRLDGRPADKVRPIYLKTGVVSQAKGSAYIEMNETKIICAVYGPRQTRMEDFSLKGQLNCEFKYSTFSCKKRRQHQQDSQEKDFSAILLEALEPAVKLEKFPKAQLDIYVTVLQNDGSALAGAITVASVAIADAGIEMYDLVVGTALRNYGDQTLIDPTEEEEYKPKLSEDSVNNCNLTVGLMPAMNQVSGLVLSGQLQQEIAEKLLKQCVEDCHRMYPVVQECILQSVQKKFEEQQIT